MSLSRPFRNSMFAALLTGILTATAPPAPAWGDITAEEKTIIDRKCTLCHTDARILTSDPEEMRAIIAKMKAKDPAFFEDVESEALADALASLMNDTQVVRQRKAWLELLERGRSLFSDPSLGTAGKSCASCHTTEKLKGVAVDFPKFDRDLKRYVSLLDKINVMISSNMRGKELPLGDPRTTALEAYLKSLQ